MPRYFDTWRSGKGIRKLIKRLQTTLIDGYVFGIFRIHQIRNSDTVSHLISVYYLRQIHPKVMYWLFSILTVKFWPSDLTLFQPRFDRATRHILTSFKNGIVRKKLETCKSLVDQRWSLVISSMRIFMFYCNTSSYSRMLPFYFLLLGVSPNLINPNVSYVTYDIFYWNHSKCSKWQSSKQQRTDAIGQRNKLLNTKTALVQNFQLPKF